MRITRVLFIALFAILSIVVWRLVDYGLSHERASSEVPTVGASNFPIADIIHTIGGNMIDVVQIVPAGADPHTFEPSPAILTTLNSADVVYGLNNSYDNWIEKYLGTDTDFIGLTEDIIPRTLPDGEEDPHMWLTVPNAKRIAAQAARDLSKRFPVHQSTFQENYANFAAALDSLDQEIRTILDTVEKKSIVTGHDAWYYFADEYSLTVLNTFEEDHDSEPSARHLQELATAMRSAGISTIYADAGVQSDALQQFANDNNFTILTVDPEGAEERNSYIHLMKTNAEAFSHNR